MQVTEKAMASPKGLSKRVQEGREAIEKSGGRLLDWNLIMGHYEAVAKVEFSDDHTVATFTLAATKSGNQKTTTMRAFNETELKKIIKKIP